MIWWGWGGWRKRVCFCVCVLVIGGISTESQSRYCRCEWVFSVSARPGLSSSPVEAQGYIPISLSAEDSTAYQLITSLRLSCERLYIYSLTGTMPGHILQLGESTGIEVCDMSKQCIIIIILNCSSHSGGEGLGVG